MSHIKQYVIPIMLLCGFWAAGAQAQMAATPVQWNADTISWSQLQSLFARNPGVTNLNIQFPNQTTWNVTPGQMQSFYSNYTQSAQSMGIGNMNRLPDLVFSSVRASGINNSNIMTVPIGNALSQMENETQLELAQMKAQGFNALRNQQAQIGEQLNTQQQNILNALPDWARPWAQKLWSMLVQAWSWVSAQLSSVFR